jgi:hypothetical protein
MNASSIAPRERRRNVRLAIVIAVVALVLYLSFWLQVVL